MDLLNKAIELCAEIEQRQAELRAILSQLTENTEPQPVEKESRDATCCVRPIEESSPADILDTSDLYDRSDKSENSDHSDKIGHQTITDLRKAFTINDRFRFRRELFGGDDKAFAAAIDRMSRCKDYNEIEAFISTFGWDSTDEDVIAFQEILSTFYNGYHL